MKFIIKLFLPLFFSFLIWLSISLSKEYYVSLPINVMVSRLPSNLIALNIQPQVFKANVKGEGWKIISRLLFYKNEFAIFDNGELGQKKIFFRDFSQNNVWLSANFQIINFEPESAVYEVDELVEKKVPIRLSCLFSTASNFIITSKIRIMPDSVAILIPKKLSNRINYLETEKLEFKNITKNFDEMIPLKLENYIFSEIKHAKVNFEVDVKADREFEKIPVKVIGEPYFRELSLYPPSVNIVLRGGVSKLASLNADSINIFVSYSEAIRDTTGKIIPIALIPEFTELVEIKPKELRYVIKKYK